jgi:hypothetical protein
MFQRRNYLPFLFSVLLVCGCDSGPELVPVSGQVNIDGKPLEQGQVTVWVKGHRPAYGVIGKDGRFALMTHQPGDGCLRGTYPVTISSQLGAKDDSITYFIPTRYDDRNLSGLSIVVDQPVNDWTIDLTWKGDKHTGPYVVR